MNEASQLQLVILYDAKDNRYTVLDHNLTPEQAAEEVEKHRGDGFPAFTVNQQRRHAVADPQDCRVCRDDVKRSSGLTPIPKFKRRK